MSAIVAQAESDLPPFHYGSHYSAAGVVLFYLIRLEPFTRLNRNLQVSVHAWMHACLPLQIWRLIVPLRDVADVPSSPHGCPAEVFGLVITLHAKVHP